MNKLNGGKRHECCTIKKVLSKIKGKFYETGMKLVMYEFECLAINKKKEMKMKVAEMRVLRWMYGVTG